MKVLILTGLPGSGKTTFAKELLGREWGYHYSADQFFTDRDGAYNFDPCRLPEAHGECLRGFCERVRLKAFGLEPIIIVDNTFTTVTEMAPYRDVAVAYGWDVEIHDFICSVDESVLRNRHNVPRKSIEGMAKRLNERHIPPWWNGTIIRHT